MPSIFLRSQQIKISGPWDDPFVLKVLECLQEHLFGIDILVKAKPSRLRSVRKQVIVPGEDEVSQTHDDTSLYR
jgi:hypothetical protein